MERIRRITRTVFMATLIVLAITIELIRLVF